MPDQVRVSDEHLIAALRARIEQLTFELVLKDAYIAQLHQEKEPE